MLEIGHAVPIGPDQLATAHDGDRHTRDVLARHLGGDEPVHRVARGRSRARGLGRLGVERCDLRIDGSDGNDEREDAMGRGEAHGVSGSG